MTNSMSMGGRTEYFPSGGGRPRNYHQSDSYMVDYWSEEEQARRAALEAEDERKRTGGRPRGGYSGDTGRTSDAERMLDAMFNEKKDIVDATGQQGTGALNDTFGGKSGWGNQWSVYDRGVVPTLGVSPGFGGTANTYENRKSTAAPTLYEFTGDGPDPERMMRYPANPEMWDKSGTANYGSPSGYGAARRRMAEIDALHEKYGNRRRRGRR